jgi:hypothetical protein
MRLRFNCVFERRRQPRLADAGLATNEHHATLAGFLDLAPAAPQKINFLLAANELGTTRAQRLEAARHSTFGQDLAGSDRFGDTLQRRIAQLTVIE